MNDKREAAKLVGEKSEIFGIDEQHIESHWPLTHVSLRKILQRTGERVVGELTSDQGTFVYKIVDVRRDRRGVEKDTAIFQELRQRGFDHAPTLLKTKMGERFQPHGKQFVYLLEFIDGITPEPTIETYGAIGKITAELHAIKNFSIQSDFDTDRIAVDLTNNSESYLFRDEYRKIVRSMPDFGQMSKSVIHTDIAPQNSIQTKSGEMYFVDWDDAGVGPTVIDLGAVLNEIVKDLVVDSKLIQAFFRSYFSHRELPKEEISTIVDAGIFFALMYIPYGDLEKRWKRIQWMVQNKDKLRTMISDAMGVKSDR